MVVQRKYKESSLVAAQFPQVLFQITVQCHVHLFQCTAQWLSTCLTPFFGCNNRVRWASPLVITNFIGANRFQQFKIIKSSYFSLPRMLRVTEFLCKCTFAPLISHTHHFPIPTPQPQKSKKLNGFSWNWNWKHCSSMHCVIHNNVLFCKSTNSGGAALLDLLQLRPVMESSTTILRIFRAFALVNILRCMKKSIRHFFFY